NNLSTFNLTELIDFKVLSFEKEISINAKKKVKVVSKYPIVKLNTLAKEIINGSTPLKSVNAYWLRKEVPWITVPDFPESSLYVNSTSQFVSQKAIDDKKVKLIPENSVLISCTATIGKVCINKVKLSTNQQINSIICDTEKIVVEYLGYYLRFNGYKLAYLTNNPGVLHVNQQMLNNFPIPLPPKTIQEKVISEIEAVEQKEKTGKQKLLELNSTLNKIFSELSHPIEKLGKLAEFKNGLNYSEKSTGESVTVVGVKDFLEDFSPNLEKLANVQIDGTLSESYKLQPEDILVVRSNGSANLVGRFVYIKELNKVTSYSGFTIRIRSNSAKIDSKYLCYCLRTETVRNKITRDPKGANIKSVNQTMLSAIDVPLPPIDVQQKIIKKAEKLEKEIAQIENGLAIMDQQKEQILKKHLE
ncbi:MAG: restriction endonuclease subunit S, partial [Balneola sp.]